MPSNISHTVVNSTMLSEGSAKSKAKKIIAAVCMLLLAAMLAGCAAPQTANQQDSEEEQPLTSSQYMSQVNQKVETLAERLQGFNEAVSREDAITMRTQADNAFAVLDEMAAIEAPEELDDLRDQYIKGCDQLKDALNSYVTLYTEIASANSSAAFDYSTYSDRIKQIQDQYDEGIKTLEDADKKATEL